MSFHEVMKPRTSSKTSVQRGKAGASVRRPLEWQTVFLELVARKSMVTLEKGGQLLRTPAPIGDTNCHFCQFSESCLTPCLGPVNILISRVPSNHKCKDFCSFQTSSASPTTDSRNGLYASGKKTHCSLFCEPPGY